MLIFGFSYRSINTLLNDLLQCLYIKGLNSHQPTHKNKRYCSDGVSTKPRNQGIDFGYGNQENQSGI